MTPLLWSLPWLGLFLFARFLTRFPSELEEVHPEGREWPLVSVVVPARNETETIHDCLTSLTMSSHPAFEVIVVDDRSEDDTAAIARAVPTRGARRVEVIAGEALPDGWLGKPWACHQGAAIASGELLLFTDADTTHAPGLLAAAVAALEEEGADLLTLVGRQRMESFWERLVQPHVFLAMLFRFPSFEKTARSRRWRDAIANGQYLLFRREAYEAIDGHEGVKDEVVEDLVLAQRVKRAGLALRVRSAEGGLSTRMYRSLGHLWEGWSKNLVLGGLQSVAPWLRPFLPPLTLLIGVAVWHVPVLTLLAGAGVAAGVPLESLGGTGRWLDTFLSGGGTVWAATAAGWTALTLAWFSARMGSHWSYGLIYPLGALVTTGIFLRAWVRGRRVEWKGRRYVVPAPSSRP